MFLSQSEQIKRSEIGSWRSPETDTLDALPSLNTLVDIEYYVL